MFLSIKKCVLLSSSFVIIKTEEKKTNKNPKKKTNFDENKIKKNTKKRIRNVVFNYLFIYNSAIMYNRSIR